MLSFLLPRVTGVRHVGAHTLWLQFSDGLEGEIDLRSQLDELSGPILLPLNDERLFSRVRIDGSALDQSFPPHRLPSLYEWRDAHREELMANWQRLGRHEAPVAIATLD